MSSGKGKTFRLATLARLTRVQFLPLILLPGLLGTTLAYRMNHAFNPAYFLLVILGIGLLHLGANAIDDCYDYQNGVDERANSMFPRDFQGWKPLPRGMITLRSAKLVSYVFFLGSLILALYFTFEIGPWSLLLGVAGVLLAIAYTAPPLKLDYRGLGLGELAILFAFGPIPVLGAFYVQSGMLSLPALLVSLPVGILTVTVLIDHDLIFFEVYSASQKMSLGTVLGRARALKLSLVLTILSYALVFFFILTKYLPVYSSLAPIASSFILARTAKTYRRRSEHPPDYGPFTVNGMIANWTFALILGLTVLL